MKVSTQLNTHTQRFPLTIPEMLLERAERSPDSVLFTCGSTKRNATDMVSKVAEAGGMLREAGVDTGDRVAIMAANRTELLDFILGCSWIGAIAVPINIASRGDQLRHILNNSGAELLIIEHELVDVVLELQGLEHLTRIWNLDSPSRDIDAGLEISLVPDRAEPVPAEAVAPSQTAAILYTSGTTGVSKGVECPNGQFYWWGINMADQLGIVAHDILYTNLPLFHTNALNAFFQAVVSDSSFVLGPKFSASQFWANLKESGATVTYLLGAMVTILAGREPSPADRDHHVRTALSPATPPHAVEPFRARFGIQLLDGYGSTETNSVIGSTRDDFKPGMMGKLRPGYEVRVVDEVGRKVAEGTPGELLVRSTQPYAIATGYHSMPEATVRAWQDLWFHTGDRVVVDSEGWFRFVDRTKDVIRRRGENISSFEVESTLRNHPAITEAAVYPVDSELGEDEVMAALIVTEPLEMAELEFFCESRLPKYAIPRFVRIVDSLPQTENGKVRKAPLRAEGRKAAMWDREAPAVTLVTGR